MAWMLQDLKMVQIFPSELSNDDFLVKWLQLAFVRAQALRFLAQVASKASASDACMRALGASLPGVRLTFQMSGQGIPPKFETFQT